jgi:hypothetical protein
MNEAAFKGCTGFESCAVDENKSFLRIEKQVFADCRLLKSFYVLAGIGRIGEDSLRRYGSILVLTFASRESLKKIVGELMLDEALQHIGLSEISILFEIPINELGVELDFAGLFLVDDENAHSKLIRDIYLINNPLPF